MKKLRLCIILISIVFFVVACSSDDTPEFVQESDFEDIDWERKAVEFGNNKVVGNKNKSGVIGADKPSLKGQLWKWHLWGIEKPTSTKLTVVGYHKETETVHQILEYDWSIQLSRGHNGEDASVSSSVKIPKTGEWAMLLYTDETLFDVLIYEINE